MPTSRELIRRVLMAARDQGISSVLFRNVLGKKLGLNITDFECLSFLTLKGVSTPTELAGYTGLSSGATTAMLDRLEKIKFIKRTPNPHDRRGILVEVGPDYQKKAQPLVAGIQQAHNELLGSYSEKELEVIADFLQRFTKNVQDYTEKAEK